jgi:hypothetical protein
MFVSVRQLIPDDLADIPPGPELARILAGFELSRLSGFDCVAVLKAQYRQANHEQARVMAAMAEVGVCGVVPDDDLTRMKEPDEFSADEVRAALVLTRRSAEARFWLAHDLVKRLPQVHAAMVAGIVDEPRARVFSEWTTELSGEQTHAVCATLLPRTAKLTTGQLIEQIKKLAIALDPDWAQRRYEQAIADRKVVGYRNSDGSANLSGCNLPLDRVAAASGHIDALAKAVKRAGDSRPIDHIRADLFLGMTDGTYAGLDDAAIIDLLTPTPASDADQAGNTHDDEAGGNESPASGDEPTRPMVGTGLELRARLSTLLGRDQYPAELAGWGYLHAGLARDLTGTLGGAAWRFAITDEHGQLTHCGTTRARPAGTPTRSAASKAIVELQVPAAVLRALAADPTALGGWAGVVTDLARQLDRDTGSADPYRADATRRAPGAALRRCLEIRDRYCIMIGCRAPAHTADKDHTLDHAKSGLTTAPNLGDACRHDHRLKGEGGWTLHQPEAGVFRWTSRLGHTYHRRPPAIVEPLPDPIPRDRALYPLMTPTDDGWEDTEIWADTPPEPDPEPDPPPGPDSCSDVPPF